MSPHRPAAPDSPSAAPRAPRARAQEADGDLAEQLLRLTKRLNRAHRHSFAPLGVTPAQGRLLRKVARHGAQPPRMADLAEQLGVVPRQVTSLVDALEKQRLVRRVADPANRRVTRIELTDGGGAVLAELRRARRAAVEELLAPLSAPERTELGELLGRLDAPREP